VGEAVTREQRIILTLVGLTNTMVEEFDVVEFLQGLAERSVSLLDCAEAGILLADPAGRLNVMASSSERTGALELLQLQYDEGPCFESYRRGREIISDDLAADAERWPTFAPAAVRAGFLSVHAIPMRVRGETIGALNLFRSLPGRLGERDIPVAQGMADIAAVALMQERAVRESHSIVEELQGALTSRVIIEQAKGVLAEHGNVNVDEAFIRLRGYARSHNLRLADVARDLVEQRLDPESLG
jgi:GAF domain-containing protein